MKYSLVILLIFCFTGINARTLEEVKQLAQEIRAMPLEQARERISNLSKSDAEAVYSVYSAEIQNNTQNGGKAVALLEHLAVIKATSLAQTRVDHLTYVVVFIMFLLAAFFSYVFVQQRKLIHSLSTMQTALENKKKQETGHSEVFRG